MEQKRRLFVFRKEESSMEEEWMRDRALLRDLLTKDPQTPPQALARATGRSVSWVKKWRKRLREGDPHDQELFCSRSRAHHAPYFRLRRAGRSLHRGDAFVSTGAFGTHARSPSLALLFAARSSSASRRGSLASV